MKYLFIPLMILIFLSCSSPNEAKEDNTTLPRNSIHLLLGEPKDADDSDDHIIVRSQYVLSYNNSKGVPNWVSWQLNKDWFGGVPRYEGNFKTDTTLPIDFLRVTHDDYTNSGFDRGHVVRAEERTYTLSDQMSTFWMTNVIPQTPELNRGAWLDFEYHCERLCKDQNKDLYIISGPVIHTDSTIKGEGKVAYPDSCFKIVVVLERGLKLSDVTKNTTVFAVLMPNIKMDQSSDWEVFQTTVDAIETSTGYDFLSLLQDDVENEVER